MAWEAGAGESLREILEICCAPAQRWQQHDRLPVAVLPHLDRPGRTGNGRLPLQPHRDVVAGQRGLDRLEHRIGRPGTQGSSEEPEGVEGPRPDRPAGVVRAPHGAVLVPKPDLPQPSVQRLCAVVQGEEVLVAALEEDRETAGRDVDGVGDGNRRRMIPTVALGVDRVAVEGLDRAAEAVEVVTTGDLLPRRRRLDRRLDRGDRHESVGVPERHPQRTQPTHRDPADEGDLATPVRGPDVGKDLVGQHRLPGRRLTDPVEPETPRRVGNDHRHRRQRAVRPAAVERRPGPLGEAVRTAPAVEPHQHRRPGLEIGRTEQLVDHR